MNQMLLGCGLPALAMALGWGIRGDYGHEAGAMIPGALVALAVCLCSGREDWWSRGTILAFLGAIGWAFGGQMSYGKIVGYTGSDTFLDVAYGYGCLFLIGALWGGIGAGILGLGFTKSMADLNPFAGPLVAIYLTWWLMYAAAVPARIAQHVSLPEWLIDSDWLSAAIAFLVAGIYGILPTRSRAACGWIALLALGWILVYCLLRGALGLRMTPPRGDNWAGCLGVYITLILWLVGTGNRAALSLLLIGTLAGGVGFALGDFVQMLGRANWGPIGQHEMLQNLDYWKWMEMLFGLVMGLGVGWGCQRLVRERIAPVENEPTRGHLHLVALLFLLVAMPWENFYKNVRTWVREGRLGESLLGLEPRWWFLVVGLLVTVVVVVAIVRHHRGGLTLAPDRPFGRMQLLFLVLMWVPVLAALLQVFPHIASRGTLFVHVKFWIAGSLCSLIAVSLSARTRPPEPPTLDPGDREWISVSAVLSVLVLVPVFMLGLAWASLKTHEQALPGSHRRFALMSVPNMRDDYRLPVGES